MPLSEHEQRLLEQLEQQLHAEDPKFASHMESASGRSLSTRHIVVGSLVAIAGILPASLLRPGGRRPMQPGPGTARQGLPEPDK